MADKITVTDSQGQIIHLSVFQQKVLDSTWYNVLPNVKAFDFTEVELEVGTTLRIFGTNHRQYALDMLALKGP